MAWVEDFGEAWGELVQRPELTVGATANRALDVGDSDGVVTLFGAVGIWPLPVHAPNGLYRLGEDGNGCSGSSGLQCTWFVPRSLTWIV